MQQQKKKVKKPIKPVKKPFMRGAAVDRGSYKSMLMFFFALLGMSVANVFMGGLMVWDNMWVNLIFNSLVLLVFYGLFYQNGAGKGAAHVNQGEIMLQRQEAGLTVDAKDRAECFHPAKGFVIGLAGSLPVMICAVLLAFVAKIQMTGLGVLPSWIESLQRQPEMAGALAFYHQNAGLGMEDILRVAVRMHIMPFVNMVGASNREGLLILERCSILPVLLPAISYGLGYLQGVKVRTQVHTDIAMGKRKRAKKERKQRNARINKGPEQLN